MLSNQDNIAGIQDAFGVDRVSMTQEQRTMASITLLSRDDLDARDNKPKGRSGRKRSPERTAAIDAFKAILREAEVGGAGEVSLEDGEDKRLVRQNLKIAGDELGLHLDVRPIKDPTRIRFLIITEEQQAAKPKRPGRPKKQTENTAAKGRGRPRKAIPAS